MNQDILIRIIRAAALGIVNECDVITASNAITASNPTPAAELTPGATPPAEAEAPKPKATRAKKVEAPPAPAAPEPVTPPTSEEAASNVVDSTPETPVAVAAAPASNATLADVQAYAYSIGKKANGGNSTDAGTKAKNWLLKNFNVAGIDAIPDVGDNYDRVLEMLIKVGATDSRKPAPPPSEDEL